MPLFSRTATKPPAERVVEALKELQSTLHMLTPAEQSEVKREIPVASQEWQEGLALSLRTFGLGPSFGESGHNMGALTQEKAGKNSGVLASSFEPSLEALRRQELTRDASRLVIVLVGLPARGKSIIGLKLEQFLSWRGYKTKTFRVGAWRRGERGENGEIPAEGNGASPTASPQVERRERAVSTGSSNGGDGGGRAPHSAASFFDSTKAYAMMTREQVTEQAFEELLTWLHEDRGQVAIFDAANVTIGRRAKLTELANQHAKKSNESIGVVFIESIVTDDATVEKLMRFKISHSPDFAGMPTHDAMADLSDRIGHYERYYQTVREAEGPYIKLFDMRAKVHACNVYGRMAKSVLPYLLAMHSVERPVFLLPVGDEFEGVQPNWLSSDGQLPSGLARWVSSYNLASELIILTSTQPSATSLASAVAKAAKAQEPMLRAQLSPLNTTGAPAAAASAVGGGGGGKGGGARDVSDGVPPSPAKVSQPGASSSSGGNASFRRRFGERVADLVGRLEPIVLEVEGSTAPVLVVACESACRTLRAFLLPDASSRLIEARETVDTASNIKPLGSDGKAGLMEFSPVESGHTGFLETRHDL